MAINDAGLDGGFMLGPGCTVYQDMPRENYNAVGRAVIKYGYYQKQGKNPLNFSNFLENHEQSNCK